MTEQEIAKRIRSEVAAVDRKYRRLITLKLAEVEKAEGEELRAKKAELEALRLEAKREHQRAYWNNRARQYEAAWTQRSKETIERDLKKAYEAGLKEIEESIMKLYNTFAKDNEVSIIKAREILTSSEYRKWRMNLEEYVDRIAGGDKGLELELNTLAMRSRITRLDKLYSETLIELDKIGRESQQRLSLFLDESYKENYTRNLFDLAKIGGIEIAASAVERINSEKVLASRWSGENYSSRIWQDKRKLSKVIKETVTSGIHQGLDIKEMSKRINDVMSSGYKNAVRLIRTEMNFVNNQATYDSFDECGILYYEFIAVLDNRTSKMCQSRDGEVYPMSEKSVGFNFPPLHPRCRSTVAPYIEGTGRIGTRIARVNGKRLFVPESMTYSEFKTKYLTKTAENNKINKNIHNGISDKSVALTARQRQVKAAEETALNKNAENFGFELLKKRSPLMTDLMIVNPLESSIGLERMTNCQRCVIALEARQKGYDVIARPSYGMTDSMRYAENWLAAFDYDPSKIHKCIGKTIEDIIKSVEGIVRGFGVNSRAIISFDWDTAKTSLKNGHVIFAQCRDDETVLLVDPQF